MIRLDQPVGNYFLRFATYPNGDMQQILQGQAIVSYNVNVVMLNFCWPELILHVQSNPSVDVMDDPAMAWMLTNGSAKEGVPELTPERLSPFTAHPPPPGAADQTHSFEIKQTDVVTWVMGRSPFVEPKIPIIYGSASDGWQADTTIHVPSNSTIDIIMRVGNHSMDTVGHFFRVDYRT